MPWNQLSPSFNFLHSYKLWDTLFMVFLHPYSHWDPLSINYLDQLRSFCAFINTVTEFVFFLSHLTGAYNLLSSSYNSRTLQQMSSYDCIGVNIFLSKQYFSKRFRAKSPSSGSCLHSWELTSSHSPFTLSNFPSTSDLDSYFKVEFLYATFLGERKVFPSMPVFLLFPGFFISTVISFYFLPHTKTASEYTLFKIFNF